MLVLDGMDREFVFHSDTDGKLLKDFVRKVTVCTRPRMDAGRLVYSFLRVAKQNHKLGGSK